MFMLEYIRVSSFETLAMNVTWRWLKALTGLIRSPIGEVTGSLTLARVSHRIDPVVSPLTALDQTLALFTEGVFSILT